MKDEAKHFLQTRGTSGRSVQDILVDRWRNSNTHFLKYIRQKTDEQASSWDLETSTPQESRRLSVALFAFRSTESKPDNMYRAEPSLRLINI